MHESEFSQRMEKWTEVDDSWNSWMAQLILNYVERHEILLEAWSVVVVVGQQGVVAVMGAFQRLEAALQVAFLFHSSVRNKAVLGQFQIVGRTFVVGFVIVRTSDLARRVKVIEMVVVVLEKIASLLLGSVSHVKRRGLFVMGGPEATTVKVGRWIPLANVILGHDLSDLLIRVPQGVLLVVLVHLEVSSLVGMLCSVVTPVENINFYQNTYFKTQVTHLR